MSKVAHLQGHSDAIYDFSVDPQNALIYSASADGHIVVWDYQKSKDGTLILKADEAFFSVYYQASTHYLYAGSRSGYVYVIDLNSARLVSREKKHAGGVFFIGEFSGKLITGGEDGVLSFGSEKLSVSNKSLRSFTQSEDQLFLGSSDHLIYVLNADFKIKHEIVGHENSVFALCSAFGELYSSGRDATIKSWDPKTYRLNHSVNAHMYQVSSLAKTQELVLSSSMDKSIKIWSPELELLKVIDFARNEGHTNCINRIHTLSDELFVSSSDDRSLMVWQLELKV